MKITFLITNITNEGGTERVVVNLCNYLSAQSGFEVAVHSISSSGGTPFFSLVDNVKVVHYGMADYSKEPSKFKKWVKKWRNTLKIASRLKHIQTDILVGTSKHLNIYMVLLVRTATIKKVGCEHFSHSAPMSSLIRILRRRLYPSLDALVILNKADYDYYVQFVSRVVQIPNFTNLAQAPMASLDQQVALAVGRHSREKGFDRLLEVWAKVMEKQPGWKLKIIGAGPDLAVHQRLCQELDISDSVVFADPTKEILAEYQKASLFLLTSRTEAFPMALLEAMTCGLACVSFDCPAGPREIIKDKEDGYLIEDGHILEMAETVSALISDELKRKHLGANAYKNARRFSLESIGKQWIDLFAKELKG
jgi:amylovoran biosynthesis glycosyltransferase AmsD